ncbi:hypothetical protein PybrP1_010197 [[Pythium] brassicae (nom. inval.)]|nr:hypothetical protein PybrP1_010197 [[Pythium] brassicae (nom. inval.)]
MARRRAPAANTLVLLLVTLAPHSTADAFSLSGLFTSGSDGATAPPATVNSEATSLFSFPSQKVAHLMTCVWRGSFERDSDGSSALAQAIDLSGALDGEETVRTHPAYPHAPVLVGAATCERVVLRWKSFEDAAWPVHKFVLQRFPDLQHRRAWATLLETNDSSSSAPLLDTFPDAHVRAGQVYSYRVQAVSTADVASAFAFHQVAVAASACSSSRALFGLLPSWAMFTTWSCDAVRTLGLLVVCFLSVYALMRAYGKRVQGPRSRNHRLKRIYKSASESTRSAGGAGAAGAMTKPPPPPAKLTQRSSSDSSSTSPPSEPLDPLASQRSIESLSSLGTRGSFEMQPAAGDARASLSLRPRSSEEKASACQNCQKRFGIFRRRHPCDICHAVTLCRRCGYQAPAGFTRSSVSAMDEALGAGGRRSSSAVTVIARENAAAAPESHRDVKIKTICRSCCEDVYRYSTAVRPRVVRRRMS